VNDFQYLILFVIYIYDASKLVIFFKYFLDLFMIII